MRLTSIAVIMAVCAGLGIAAVRLLDDRAAATPRAALVLAPESAID